MNIGAPIAVFLWLICAVLITVTILPFSHSHRWWVRIWDFPRVQTAICLGILIALFLVLPVPGRWLGLPLLGAALGWQLHRIRPFTRLAATEMKMAEARDPEVDVVFLAANVQMENTNHAKVARLIQDTDPDVILLMETDSRWIEALDPVLRRWPTIIRVPQDNHYGLVFATRLDAEQAREVYLTPDRIPSIHAILRDRQGRRFGFLGLHPRPPVPGEDTEERDAQILHSALCARDADLPVVVMGDFNDAAWSPTARRFKEVGRYLDPRVGRGLYASHDANNPLLRTPIDQVHITEDVVLVEFGLGGHVGSDHFPLVTRLRFDAAEAASLNIIPPHPTPEARARMEETLKAYRQKLRDGNAGT